MGTPNQVSDRIMRPRADSVRVVEHAPVRQLAVEGFKNPVPKVPRVAIPIPKSEVRYAKFEGQVIFHETTWLHAALVPAGPEKMP